MNSKLSRRNCKQYREMVSLFIDTELEQGSEHDLFRHLGSCKECQSYLDVMMKFKVAKQHDQVEYPPELDSSIFEELKIRKNVYSLGKVDLQQVRLPIWKRRIAVSMPLAAAFMFVVLLGLGSIIYSMETPASAVKEGIVTLFQAHPRVEVRDQFIYPMPMQTVLPAKEQIRSSENL